MSKFFRVYIITTVILSLLVTSTFKVITLVANQNETIDFFLHYIYKNFFSYLFLVFTVLGLIYFLFSVQLMKPYRNNILNVIARFGYRVGRILIVLIMTGFLLMSIQVIGDYNIYRTGEFKEEVIFITNYELSDGPRLSNSTFPYIIKSSNGHRYYLYKQEDLSKSEFIVKYMISTNGRNVILGISKKA